MVSASRLATTISIIYFSIYIFVFFIASIYCAYEVEKRHHLIIKQSSKKQNKSDIDSEKPNEIECMVMSTNDKTDKDDNIDAKDNTDNKHMDVNITDIYDQSCLFKLIRSDNKENKELLQYLIEGKNANWVIVNDTNESLPALADKIKKKEIVNYFRTLHDRKKGEFTFKELLDLWGLKKYVLRFQEEKYADIQRWNELIDDEKKLTALVEVSNALYSEEINERRTKLNVELFKNNYQKWLQVKDNKKQFFDAFFL
eukprot:32807_1